ncbi:AsmA-like C-terminal region-containing protein [Stieleria sp. TO1_6]|uniref:AsmA-like C-terminal region-containing protein n=1 Tax=Stieleria tagensis TaxID=2956795 RepID=UPI00209A864F|nr:AsmA-like C-terminal region-containing protein [Stieleria tagensis]MCO8123984.1 AsmA-like C-terminal region-containing protein [Stieleria tagensis]
MLALTVGILARNSITRVAAVHIASRVIGARVEIGSVSIGWSQISVRQIKLFEPAMANQQQLLVERMSVVPNLLMGLRRGIWLERIEVEKPLIHVRLDADGKLLSQFPQGSQTESTGEFNLPLQQIRVIDAGLVVHQFGRQDWKVDRVEMRADVGANIEANAVVPDLLGARIDVRCSLDAKTLGGSSRLSLAGMKIDTTELARLPLVPADLAAERISAEMGFTLEGTHPANELNPLAHSFQFQGDVHGIYSERLKTLCEHVSVSATYDTDELIVAAKADPLRGRCAVNVTANLIADRPTVSMHAELADLHLHSVARLAPELEQFDSRLQASASIQCAMTDGGIDFDGRITSRATQNEYDKIALPDIDSLVSASGRLVPDQPNSLQGVVNGQINSQPFDLTPLADLLGLPPAHGSIASLSQFEIPLGSINDPATYAGHLNLQIQGIECSELTVDDTTVIAKLKSGLAEVSVSEIVIRDAERSAIATVSPTLEASLLGKGRLSSRVQLALKPSRAIVSRIGAAQLDPQGEILVQAQAECGIASLQNPADWSVDVRLQAIELAALGETLQDIEWQARLKAGGLEMDPLVLTWRDSLCTVDASGAIGTAISLDGNVSVERLQLKDLGDVASRFSSTPLPLSGLASVDGKFAILQSLDGTGPVVKASGVARLERAVYANAAIGNARLNWDADLSGLLLSSASEEFLGGQYQITARMRDLDWTRTQLEGKFAGIQVPRLVAMSGQPVPSTGTLQGGCRLTSLASLQELSGEAWLESRQVSVQRLPIEIGVAKVTVAGGELAVQSEGRIADGHFDVVFDGSIPQLTNHFATPNRPLSTVPVTGQFKLAGLSIHELVDSLGLPREAMTIGGTLSAECSRDQAAWDGRHLCVASGAVEDLRLRNAGLSERITVDMTLMPDRLEVNGIRGRLADGMLSGTALVRLESIPTGHFDVAAKRVNLRRLASPLGVQDVSGTGTVSLRGRIGPIITGAVDITADNVVAAGVAVRQARFPVTWSFTPNSKIARWQCRSGVVATGGGNVRVATEGNYANSLTMNTAVHVEKVDLAKLMRSGSVGSGIVDGEASLRAKRARTTKQLVGDYAFEMKNIQALEIPILNQLPKMVTLSPPVPGRGQDGGIVRGRIGSGLVYLDELAVHQSNVQVMVSGTATMEGRLDLDVVASTESESPADQLVSLLDSPLMLAAPAPVALVVKANELLKDRVVRVHVGGTADRPTLRLQPGKQLSQDAVRFFLTNSFGSTVSGLANSKTNTQRR